jgi:23S rRNA pseudouridine1911/1915/1917 synthase
MASNKAQRTRPDSGSQAFFVPHSQQMALEPSRILYLDENCVVINKLAGEAVEGAGPGMGDLCRIAGLALSQMESSGALMEGSLKEKSAAAASAGKTGNRLPLPTAVHRLDVPATGCALFARTQTALVFLNAAFSGLIRKAAACKEQSQAVEKHYWAVVEKPQKEISPSAGLTHWIQFDRKKNKSHAFDEPGPGRKKAVLQYSLIGAGENYLFLDIELVSGRHHQIRCQLERIGLHIKGDLKYGARRSEAAGGIRLHARSLAFPNPTGGDRISVCADPPVTDNLWRAFMTANA